MPCKLLRATKKVSAKGPHANHKDKDLRCAEPSPSWTAHEGTLPCPSATESSSHKSSCIFSSHTRSLRSLAACSWFGGQARIEECA